MVNIPHRTRCGAGGFTYLGVLLAVAIMSGGGAAASQVWHTRVQRANETELLFIGEQFKHALERYYEASPGGVRRFPQTLEELVLDTRHPVVVRHLRRIYADPVTHRREWGLVKQGDRIVGIFSLSDKTPFTNRGAGGAAGATPRYSDWKFMAEVAQP